MRFYEQKRLRFYWRQLSCGNRQMQILQGIPGSEKQVDNRQLPERVSCEAGDQGGSENQSAQSFQKSKQEITIVSWTV